MRRAADVGDAHAVDQVVGDDRRDEFAAQPVALRSGRPNCSATGGGKYSSQHALQVRLVRARRWPAGGWRGRPWRSRAAPRARGGSARPRPGARRSISAVDGRISTSRSSDGDARCPAGQALRRRRLEVAHERLVGIHADGAGASSCADDPGLQVDVAQHLGGDLVGAWRRAARRARSAASAPSADGGGQQDLEVDLVVGGVDAGRVVDRVGVDASAAACELDAAPLRERRGCRPRRRRAHRPGRR